MISRTALNVAAQRLAQSYGDRCQFVLVCVDGSAKEALSECTGIRIFGVFLGVSLSTAV